MSILSALSVADTLRIPITLYNTGTLLDLTLGSASRGVDKKWYIHGGLGTFITGCAGHNGTFKSTVMDGMAARVMHYYDGTETVAHDTEGSKSQQRMITCGGPICRDLDPARIDIRSGKNTDVQTVWKHVQEIGAYKEAHVDDYLRESPFLDPLTCKPVRVWVPTILFIDSFTELESVEETDMMADKDGLNDKKIKTVWMVDGNKKTLLTRHLRKACETYGIIIICTAHIGDNIAMDSYSPPTKQFQHMKQADRLKGVGSRFEFLARTLLSTKSTVLQDNDKAALYGSEQEQIPPTDQNEVAITTVRTKERIAGGVIPFVVSQSYGLLNELTYYHYLRCNDYFGLVGNKVTQASALLPTVKMTRNSASRVLAERYEHARAMELCAQFHYIKQNWMLAEKFPALNLEPTAFYEQLQKTSPKIDEILASTGVWQYDRPKDARPYMSILDVLELLNK